MNEEIRRAISLVHLRNLQILLVQKRRGEVWILPGGKPLPGETDDDCLKREVAEELSGTGVEIYKPFGEFTGAIPNVGDALTATVLFGRITDVEPKPSGEIIAAGFFGIEALPSMHISDITKKVIESLDRNKHL